MRKLRKNFSCVTYSLAFINSVNSIQKIYRNVYQYQRKAKKEKFKSDTSEIFKSFNGK